MVFDTLRITDRSGHDCNRRIGAGEQWIVRWFGLDILADFRRHRRRYPCRPSRSRPARPGNPQGWNRLGHLLMRAGNLSTAEGAYGKVLALGEKTGDKGLIAAAYTRISERTPSPLFLQRSSSLDSG